MLLEKAKMQLTTHKVEFDGKNYRLSSPHTNRDAKISETQNKYLELLKKGMTVEELVNHYLAKNELVSFRELYNLIETMIDFSIISNNEVRRYFEKNVDQHVDLRVAPTSGGVASIRNWNTRSILTLPFFRTLKPDVAEHFVQNCSLTQIPERTKLISIGDEARDLYVILEGEASIYRQGFKNRRELITIIPAGSVFGEGAFLLNKPRSADVITNVPCILAKIEYNEKVFGPLLKSTQTLDLQQRLWILHGLLSSPIFHNVPSETMDRFAYMGQTHEVANGHMICKEGQQGDSFFVIIQGEVVITMHNRELKKLKQGDILGEIALLISNGHRTATAQAIRDCLLFEVKRDQFYKVLGQNLILANEIETIAYNRFANQR